jgi:heme exporter protein D
MSLGPHAAFIWFSYLVVAVAVAGLIAWLVMDGRRYTRRLAELEARGVRRRSAGAPGPGDAD